MEPDNGGEYILTIAESLKHSFRSKEISSTQISCIGSFGECIKNHFTKVGLHKKCVSTI